MPSIVEMIKLNSSLNTGTIINLLKNPKDVSNGSQLTYGAIIPLYSNVVDANHSEIVVNTTSNVVDTTVSIVQHNVIHTHYQHKVCLHE